MWVPGLRPRAEGPSSLPLAVSQALAEGTPVDPALVAADNGLGLDLAGRLRLARPGANLVLSPLSVALALDMAYSGAGGATRQAMAGALQLGSMAQAGPEQANAALQASFATPEPHVQLKVANSLWARQGMALPTFLALNQTYYGAYVGDLAGGPDAVNAWASQQTQGQISALLPPATNCQAYDLLLVNTVYFRGDWRVPFDPQLTQDRLFTRKDGSQVSCPMMQQTGPLAYEEQPNFQAVRLAYGQGRYGMILMLPAPGVALEEVAQAITPAGFQALVQGLDGTVVRLTLPRFSCASTSQLKGPLSDLGMGVAFDPQHADFSLMATQPQAMLAVVHRALIAVDEHGTLAAAGSAVQMAPTAVFGSPRPMVLDRPFLMMIVDADTGTLLFLGQLADPSQDGK